MKTVIQTTATIAGSSGAIPSTCFGQGQSRSFEFPQEMSRTVDLGIRISWPANDSTLTIESPRPTSFGPVASE